MKSLLKYIFFIPLLVAVSCSKEYSVGPSVTDTGEKDILLKVAIPYTAPKDAATRSIGATQENTIETLDVLAFKVESGVETFLYKAAAKKDAGNVEGNSLQTFNVKLRVQDYEQRFVLISNAHGKIEDLINSHLSGWVGEEKEDMLKNLIFDLTGSDRWNAISASNYTAIPMWGETAPKVISATTTSISDSPIPMLRMVAKIDVHLDESVPGIKNTFKLKSVHLYNTNTSGRIVPMSGTEYVGTDMIAKKASLPYPVNSVVGPLFYNDFNPPSGEIDVAMRGAIYLFETAAKNAGNPLQETSIVVGGYYGTDSYETYYRLDFFASDGTTHLDILRNHKYTFNISAVHGRGYATVDEAYREKPFNMKTNLTVWDEGDIRFIYFDRQYMLGVSHDYFEFDGELHDATATDNILKVTTDHPNGWEASVWADMAGTIPVPDDAVVGLPWLFIFPGTGAGGAQPDDVRLLVLPNTGTLPRTAYIHVQAGNLSCIVEVVQNVLPTVITVSPDLVMFPYNAQTPASQAVTVTATKGGNPDPAASWTLVSFDPWLSLTLNSDGSGASDVVNGTGSKQVYLVATENTGAERVTELYLNGTIPVVTVIQAVSTVPVITVTPATLTLSHLAQPPAMQSIIVTPSIGGVVTPSVTWTLRTSQSWLWLSPNADGTGAVNTFTTPLNGTGQQTIYLVVGKNGTPAPRYADITLNGTTDVVTKVTQLHFDAIGQPGGGVERIYIEDNNYDPKLMLTKDNSNPGAFLQFGGIKAWKQPTSNMTGVSAVYNPSNTSSIWDINWQPSGYVNGYVVVHTVASLLAGTGDPCRLVGYTESEIIDALNNNIVPDNQMWRLPDGGQLQGFTSNSETFPRFGYVNRENGNYIDNGATGNYWGSWQSAGGATYTNAGLMRSTASSKIMYSLPPADLMGVRCVAQ